MGKLQTFWVATKRILIISKKPTGSEYRQMSQVTGLGIIIIGLIGFVVLFIFAISGIGI